MELGAKATVGKNSPLTYYSMLFMSKEHNVYYESLNFTLIKK